MTRTNTIQEEANLFQKGAAVVFEAAHEAKKDYFASRPVGYKITANDLRDFAFCAVLAPQRIGKTVLINDLMVEDDIHMNPWSAEAGDQALSFKARLAKHTFTDLSHVFVELDTLKPNTFSDLIGELFKRLERDNFEHIPTIIGVGTGWYLYPLRQSLGSSLNPLTVALQAIIDTPVGEAYTSAAVRMQNIAKQALMEGANEPVHLGLTGFDPDIDNLLQCAFMYCNGVANTFDSVMMQDYAHKIKARMSAASDAGEVKP